MTSVAVMDLAEDIAVLLNNAGLTVSCDANLITIDGHGDSSFTLTINEIAQPLAEGEVPQWPA